MLTDAYGSLLATEMIRQVSGRFAWATSSFRQSTLGLLREVVVAGRYADRQVLGQPGFEELSDVTRARVLADPGLGGIRARGPYVQRITKKAQDFRPGSHLSQGVEALASTVQAEYVVNWRAELSGAAYAPGSAGPAPVPATEVASLLVAHLLQLGLDPEYLSNWITYRLVHAPASTGAVDLLDEIQDLIETGHGPMPVLLIIERPVSPDLGPVPGQMDAAAARAWLVDAGVPSARVPRQLHGAVLLNLCAWSVHDAMLQAAEAANRLRHRAALRTGRPLGISALAFPKGPRTERRLPDTSVLHQAPRYDGGISASARTADDERLEVAFQFLQAGAAAGRASASGMLWAALESLLVAPGDGTKIEAAVRGADLGTAAVLRLNHLTALGAALEAKRGDPALRSSVDGLGDADRLQVFYRYLKAGAFGGIVSPSVRHHVQMTADLGVGPGVSALRRNVLTTLRGLYRQRNLLLHGGVTNAPLRDELLLASGPLVAGVLNRCARGGDGPQVLAFDDGVRLDRYESSPGDVAELVDP